MRDEKLEDEQQLQDAAKQHVPSEEYDEFDESSEELVDETIHIPCEDTDRLPAEVPTDTKMVSDEQKKTVEPTIESVIEAVLFASDQPLTASRLADIVGAGSVKSVREHIERLNEKYLANNHAFTIEQIAGGYQMLTFSVYNSWLAKLVRVRDESKLSQAALETLAIVAYKQPIIRADIEVIRGVAVGEVLRSLMYKGLVKIVGRAEVLGRPMLYGTTKKFLETFGLNSLKDLPKIEELKRPE
ncbi:MAG: SMC-Scp complex subunit ScpB [Planctomycetota bacterium]